MSLCWTMNSNSDFILRWPVNVLKNSTRKDCLSNSPMLTDRSKKLPSISCASHVEPNAQPLLSMRLWYSSNHAFTAHFGRLAVGILPNGMLVVRFRFRCHSAKHFLSSALLAYTSPYSWKIRESTRRHSLVTTPWHRFKYPRRALSLVRLEPRNDSNAFASTTTPSMERGWTSLNDHSLWTFCKILRSFPVLLSPDTFGPTIISSMKQNDPRTSTNAPHGLPH